MRNQSGERGGRSSAHGALILRVEENSPALCDLQTTLRARSLWPIQLSGPACFPSRTTPYRGWDTRRSLGVFFSGAFSALFYENKWVCRLRTRESKRGRDSLYPPIDPVAHRTPQHLLLPSVGRRGWDAMGCKTTSSLDVLLSNHQRDHRVSRAFTGCDETLFPEFNTRTVCPWVCVGRAGGGARVRIKRQPSVMPMHSAF